MAPQTRDETGVAIATFVMQVADITVKSRFVRCTNGAQQTQLRERLC